MLDSGKAHHTKHEDLFLKLFRKKEREGSANQMFTVIFVKDLHLLCERQDCCFILL